MESFVYDEISRKSFVTQSYTIHEGRLYFQDINKITNPTCYHWQRLYMKKFKTNFCLPCETVKTNASPTALSLQLKQ